MKSTFISIIVLVLVATGLFFVFGNKKSEAPTVEKTESTSVDNGTNTNTGETSTPTVSGGVSVQVPPVGNTSLKEFTVTGKNFSFTPNTITVKKGDKVRIIFKNENGFHNLKIDEFKVGTKTIDGGSEDSIEFLADKVGSFQYYCSVGTHRQQGMWGTLKVE